MLANFPPIYLDFQADTFATYMFWLPPVVMKRVAASIHTNDGLSSCVTREMTSAQGNQERRRINQCNTKQMPTALLELTGK